MPELAFALLFLVALMSFSVMGDHHSDSTQRRQDAKAPR